MTSHPPRSSLLLLLPLGLLGCPPAKIDLDTGESASPDSEGRDSAVDSSGDSTDTADESGRDTSGETGRETGDTGDVVAVSGIVVTVHPDVVTLLNVDWTQDVAAAEGWIEFTFDDGDVPAGTVWEQSRPAARSVGPQHDVAIGIPAETLVTVRVASVVNGVTVYSTAVQQTTGVLPDDLPIPTIPVYDEALASPERWMMGSLDVSDNWYYGPYWSFILDRKGRYVWYHETPDSRGNMYTQPSWDGNHVYIDGQTQYVFDSSVHAGIIRMTLDGTYYEDIPLSHLGFASDEGDGGSILYEYRDGADVWLAEHMPDGTDTLIWNCTSYFRENGLGSERTCNPNTIVLDRDRGTVMWSMYKNNTVFEVDRATGEVYMRFGQLAGGWTFDPPESVVDYQHYVNWSPDGTIIASTHIVGESGVQRAREYEVDPTTQTLTNVWTFGETTDHWAEYGGEAWRLPNRNTLIGYGTDGAVLEVTYDGEVAWDVEWPSSPNTHALGHMTLIDDLYALNQGE